MTFLLSFVGVEEGEVFADCFIGGIALNSFCAAVPRNHLTVGVECENCVVSDASNKMLEKAVFYLGFVQGSLTLFVALKKRLCLSAISRSRLLLRHFVLLVPVIATGAATNDDVSSYSDSARG